MSWSIKAAKQGNANAKYFLGVLYELGDGVKRNIVLAYAWYNLASAHEFKDAAIRRGRLSEKMTTSQISQAEEFSRIFLKVNWDGSGFF